MLIGVKVYSNCSLTCRTQGRLHKLVDDMPSSDVPRVRDDSNVNIVRDGDSDRIHGTYMVTTVEDSDLEGEGIKFTGFP